MLTQYDGVTAQEWVDYLCRGDVVSRSAAALALAEIGPDEEPVLSALAAAVRRDPEKAVRMAAMFATGFVELNAGARSLIFRGLRNPDPILQRLAIKDLASSYDSIAPRITATDLRDQFGDVGLSPGEVDQRLGDTHSSQNVSRGHPLVVILIAAAFLSFFVGIYYIYHIAYGRTWKSRGGIITTYTWGNFPLVVLASAALGAMGGVAILILEGKKK